MLLAKDCCRSSLKSTSCPCIGQRSIAFCGGQRVLRSQASSFSDVSVFVAGLQWYSVAIAAKGPFNNSGIDGAVKWSTVSLIAPDAALQTYQ